MSFNRVDWLTDADRTASAPRSLCTGMLAGGINTGPMVHFIIAILSQWFLRTRKPKWFVKYNYILGAGMCPSVIGTA